MKEIFNKGNWLLTLPLAAVGVVYLYFLFLPAQREIDRLRSDLQAQRQSVTQLHEREKKIYETNEELQRAVQFVAEWKQKNKADAASVLAQISDEVEKSGVQTMRFDPEATDRFETLRKTPLMLGTQGDFQQVFRMLQQLEALPSTIWIEHFHIETAERDGRPLSNEVNLAIFTGNAENSD
jgi:Tfp pilus assembly protein PilO